MQIHTRFLDMLGNDVTVGDTIVYPAAAGSSAAELNTAVVEEIIPIYPDDPTDPDCRRGHTQTGTSIDKTDRYIWPRRVPGAAPLSSHTGRSYTVTRYPTEYDPDRLYILRVKKEPWTTAGSDYGDGKSGVMIKNIDRIVVVTSLLGADA